MNRIQVDVITGEISTVELTPEETDELDRLEAIRIAAIPPIDQKAVILAQINALDPIDQLRPMRDGLMYLAIKEGAALGLTEPQIYAANIGYRRMKDREAELEVLRQQLKALP